MTHSSTSSALRSPPDTRRTHPFALELAPTRIATRLTKQPTTSTIRRAIAHLAGPHQPYTGSATSHLTYEGHHATPNLSFISHVPAGNATSHSPAMKRLSAS